MNSPGRLSNILVALDSALLGSTVALLRANRKVKAKLTVAEPEHYADDMRLSHKLEQLETAQNTSVTRIQRIEDKATGTAIGVGISVTIIGSASAFLGAGGPLAGAATGTRMVVAALLVLAMLFLLVSGYFALRARAVGEVYGATLYDMPPLVSSENAKLVVLYSIEQNHKVAILRTNYLTASYACLRNGLALLAVLGLVLVVMSYLAAPGARDVPASALS